MTKFHYAVAAMLTAMSMTVVSCSDDNNDEPTPDPTPDTPTEVTADPTNVFTQGVPSQVGDYNITLNAQGQVAKIVEDDMTVTFDYTKAGAASRAGINIPADYDMTMKVEWGGSPDGVMFYIQLNEQGFVKYAYEVDKNEDYETGGWVEEADEWWFTYNAEGQLITMKRSEGDNEVTTMTYVNGDITSVKTTDDYSTGNDDDSFVISYTGEGQAAIENKGGIMLYDEILGIDMDEMAPAYYAGILGKATVHLPLSAVETWTNTYVDENGQTVTENYTANYKYSWTLNAAGLPTQLVVSDDSWSDDPIDFKW